MGMGVGGGELGAWVGRKPTSVPDAREGRGPTSGETGEAPVLRGMNQGSLAAWTLPHPFAEGRSHHQPSFLPPPVRLTVAPIFSIRFLLHFCSFLGLESRADALNAPAHLLPSSSLNCMRGKQTLSAASWSGTLSWVTVVR